MTKTLLGYSDRFSVRPGEPIAFKVSSETGQAFDLSIVRILHGDTNPAGLGFQETAVAAAVNGRYPGVARRVEAGSFAIVPAAPALAGLSSFSASISLWPTRVTPSPQALMALWDPERGRGFALLLEAERGPVLRLGDGARIVEVALGQPLAERRWTRLDVRFDAASGEAELVRDGRLTIRAATGLGGLGDVGAPLLFAGLPRAGGGYEAFFNGKLEAPCLAGPGGMIGRWDFSRGIDGEIIEDVCGGGLHGRTVQLPARGVTGSNWREARSWRDAPDQYGAIHFHDDDLADAGWPDSAVWTPPAGLDSGLYAAKLIAADDEDYIPFVIAPPLGATRPERLLLILPSASYLAYANEHLAIDAPLAERVHDHVPAFGPNDLYTAAHRELGGSLYDRHGDDSGIMISSHHRPILNMRPKYQSWLGGGTHSSLWQLNADTHIIGWLERRAIAYDVISDEDLHHHGPGILAGYRCVMTGTHPEYVSTAMLDALEGFQAGGGRLIYMGGNGFYWRIAFHPHIPGVIEVRRCEVGNGWITPPGESCHAFNGEYGGLWRRVGRAPQALTGVGFIAQGFDGRGWFRRTPESHDPRAAFIFEGVDGDVIGDFGLIGGGAAGIELDCVDPMLGTPANALVVARSEGHSDNSLPTLEALLINYVGQGASQNAMVRADMTFFETAAGGAVFSTGSIAWAGALAHNGDDNPVSRITANVVRRFLDPTGFPRGA
jgi:N,N-dimethylformamidase